ncbi:MAG: hypothetical protein PW788_14410 [Micavibrio sp.]|nr:hypothetical protein [Micavibrio sp.]
MIPDLLEPKLQFRGLTETQIRAAREDKSQGNLVALELGRLLFEYSKYVQDHIRQQGYTAEVSAFLYEPPRWPIEKVAKEMAQALISAKVLIKPNNREDKQEDTDESLCADRLAKI